MAVLVDKNTRLIVQGITGKEGTFHMLQMREYGTNVVGGVTPGKGGTTHEGVPVFNTVADAVKETGANASVIYVPPPFAADAIMEAADAGIPLIVCITEGIPVADMVKANEYVKHTHDPNDRPELPRHDFARQMQNRHHARAYSQRGKDRRRFAVGNANVRSRRTIDCSRVRTIDRDRHRRRPDHRNEPYRALRLFQADDETDAIVMIGEIGGSAEEEAAEYAKDNVTKPIVAFIAGTDRASGTSNGPRRSDHIGRQRHGGREDEGSDRSGN